MILVNKYQIYKKNKKNRCYTFRYCYPYQYSLIRLDFLLFGQIRQQWVWKQIKIQFFRCIFVPTILISGTNPKRADDLSKIILKS